MKGGIRMRIDGSIQAYMERPMLEHDFIDASGNNTQEQEMVEFIFPEHQFIDAIKSSSENLKPYGSKLEFSIHEKTGDVMIKVVDSITDELIREIPPRKIIDMLASMLERAGLLVDKRA